MRKTMKIKCVLIFFYLMVICACVENDKNAQDSQSGINGIKNIHDVVDKEILISSGFDVDSFTVVFENGEYYLYRRCFTDERLTTTIKYNLLNKNDYSFSFRGVISIPERLKDHFLYGNSNELFDIDIYRGKLNVSLNSLDLIILYIK